MKRLVSAVFIAVLCLVLLSSCISEQPPIGDPSADRPRLSSYIGVWTNKDENCYYRFTTEATWYYYDENGEVDRNGDVEFDGEVFTLVCEDGAVYELFADDDGFRDQRDEIYHRTESPLSLISSVAYEGYFNDWYEQANLEGNVLSVNEPDSWFLKNAEGEVLVDGVFYAYAEEPGYLYLHTAEEGKFYCRLFLNEKNLIQELPQNDRMFLTHFALREDSTVRYFYFKEKNVECNYILDSGFRLLRNGGAAYNDERDYKKMPVTCSVSTVSDSLDENGMRQLVISVDYEFKRNNLPYLSGGRFYNSVRFSQYDYYTGDLFNLEDSTGNENLISSWETSHDGVTYQIACKFLSEWEYSQSEDVLARWKGTYELSMPADYDGFVICLRPVFNSYSAQVSSVSLPVEGTKMMEDVGDDVEKSIFCRIPKFSEPYHRDLLAN